MWLNEYEIADAVLRLGHLPNLGAAARTLEALAAWTNGHSDGWPYWQPPSRAASKLQDLIYNADRWDPQDVTAAQLKAALRPVKAFRTRHGARFEIEEPA